METSEYDFHYEPYRRVPVNSATTQKEFTDYNSYGTLSTYSLRHRSFKRSMTTTYIDGSMMFGEYDRPYSMKDIFPQGKGRRKSSNSSEKKMNARDAYMSLLPTDASTIRSEKTRSPLSMAATATQVSSLPEVLPKSADIRKKNLSNIVVFDDKNESKRYARCATTNVKDGWIRRYKSINASQTLSNLLRDELYKDKVLLKKRSYRQSLVYPSPSSSFKRRRDESQEIKNIY